MLERLRSVLRHPVGRNVVGLYGVQLATFLIPLLTLPYVARVLEPSGLGVVIFAQGFTFVLLAFIDWGFGLTGVRSVAAVQDDPVELARVVQRVRGAQLLLVLASSVFAVAALVFVPSMRDHPELVVLAYLAAAGLGLAPDWFFLGIEKMRRFAVVQLAFRIVAAALTFVLVRDAGDAWIVMALFAAGGLGSLLVTDVMMYRRIAFRPPRLRLALRELRHGSIIFGATLAVTFYTAFNVVLLGFFVSSADVAHFGAAERIVRVAITLLGPVGAAVIPRMSALQAAGERARAKQLLYVAVGVCAVPALVMTATLVVFAEPIIRIVYGPEFVADSVPLLRVLAFIIPINVVAAVCGVWLMTLHRDRLVTGIAIVAALTNVILGSVLVTTYGTTGMAWSVITAESCAALGGVLAITWGALRAGRGRAPTPKAAGS